MGLDHEFGVKSDIGFRVVHLLEAGVIEGFHKKFIEFGGVDAWLALDAPSGRITSGDRAIVEEKNLRVAVEADLLGFENRELSHEDFTNDKVISEPFGSGGYGVALYELVLRTDGKPVESGYKYAKVVTTGSTELGTVKVRYKEPLEDSSKEIECVITSAQEDYTDNLRLAYVVYVCAEKLRGSDKITKEDIKKAQEFYDELGEEIREMNEADLYKLPEILKRTARELHVGIGSMSDFDW